MISDVSHVLYRLQFVVHGQGGVQACCMPEGITSVLEIALHYFLSHPIFSCCCDEIPATSIPWSFEAKSTGQVGS